MKRETRVFKLKGRVQHYAWGGYSFLPELLSLPNAENKPFAEYWLGAHDNASSELMGMPGDSPVPLNQYIREHPDSTLGARVAGRFGRLPYLLKILDVKDMLSIQVHPSKKEAEKEFAVENSRGISLLAPDRNYKDDNHKPELMVALSEFWLLHGFKPFPLLRSVLRSVPELEFLLPSLEKGGYLELYRVVMEMGLAEVNARLQPLLDRIIPAYHEGRLSKDREDFWAARAALTFREGNNTDRGIFSIYLFNLVNLHPGEAIFQDAGLPHAYLEGQNVEIMANSDNVLRGGLTPKHIDVQALMKHIVFEETIPRPLSGRETASHMISFITPAPDFELSRIALGKGAESRIGVRSVEIFMVLEGGVGVGEGETDLFERRAGTAFIAFDGADLRLKADAGSVIYRAAVPSPDR